MVTRYTGCQLDEPPPEALASAPPVAPFEPHLDHLPPHVWTGRNWLGDVNPSDHQGDDTTCVLRAYAGNAEAIARRAGVYPRGKQIAVARVYRRVMDGLYDGHDKRGMTLTDGLYGCLGEGILPPGTTLRYARTLQAIAALLRDGPPILAMHVTRGWYRTSPNGYCDPLADRAVIGGHAVLLLAILQDHGEPYLLFQDWQGPRLGWHGCRIIHWRAFKATTHSAGACLPVRPAGAQGWDGWRGLLVDDAEGNE